MITLTLLHPSQTTPLQHWTFDEESVIRIGRSTNNQVVLYSVVVSRHHVELRRKGSDWEIENLGSNKTFVDGRPITKIPIVDGMIFRLAITGPQIKINLVSDSDPPQASANGPESSDFSDSSPLEPDSIPS